MTNSYFHTIFDLTQTFVNPNPGSFNDYSTDGFGTEIAISGDKVLVGARDDGTFGNFSGAAYLFSTVSGNLTQTFFYPQLDSGDTFGTAVAIDGNKVLIGASGERDFGSDGAALLFNADSGKLIQTFSISNSDTFGSAVAIDGNKVIVGDVQNDTFASVSGAAFLFDAVSGNNSQNFFPPNPSIEDFFGGAVAIDGNKVLVGASGGGRGTNKSGSAYLFDANGKLLQTFLNPSPDAIDYFGDYFGGAVAIHGNKVLIGATGEDRFGNSSGAAYLFDAVSGNLLQSFFSPNPNEGDEFGGAVAIDGDQVLIGSVSDDTVVTNGGAAYLFDTVSGNLIQSFFDPSPAEDDSFGSSVAIEANNLLIGAPQDDQGGSNSGSVFLFQSKTFNIINGTNSKDKLVGTLRDDKINGLNSNDTLKGLDGNDTLNGGCGNDILIGGCGNDILIGSAGNDILTGGAGNDQFVYQSLSDKGSRGDAITDFNQNHDQLILSKLFTSLGYSGSNPITDGYLRFVQSGASTKIQIDSNGGADCFKSLATLNNFTATNLVLDANIFV